MKNNFVKLLALATLIAWIWPDKEKNNLNPNATKRS